MSKWADISGYNGKYKINRKGDIISFTYKKVRKLKLSRRPSGYIYTCLGSKTLIHHRIVAKTFIPNPENKPEVNHKNNIRWDNRVENLEWATHSENMKHSFDSGSRKPPVGILNSNSKLIESDVIEIRTLHKTGQYKNKQLADFFKISPNIICKIIKNKSWKHLPL